MSERLEQIRQRFEKRVTLVGDLNHRAYATADIAYLLERLTVAERLASALRPFVTGAYAEEVLEAAALAQWDVRLRLPVQYTQHVEESLSVGDLVEARAALHGWDTEENT